MTRRALIVASLCCGGLLLADGCVQPQPGSAERPLESDIVEVKKFYSAFPWLSFDEEGDPNPEGFKMTVYLISSETGRGAFGDGDIIVSLYSYPPYQAGRRDGPNPTLEKEWVLDPEAAMPFRAKTRKLMGYGYGLRLNWGDIDVLGKTISIRIAFQRRDGRLIKSQPQSFRVPARKYNY